jgi:hypothetical protein
LRAACGVTLALAFVAPASWIASTCSAEIFKCAEKNGLVRYQNFPCAIDSLGSLPKSPASGKAPAPSEASRLRAKPAGDDAARKTAQLAGIGEPRAGMTPDEVRAIWGEPEQVVQDEPPGGRVEIWEYGDGKLVRFDASKQRVLSVQR